MAARCAKAHKRIYLPTDFFLWPTGPLQKIISPRQLFGAKLLLLLIGFATQVFGSEDPTIPKIHCAPQQRSATLALSFVAQIANPPGNAGPHWVIKPLPSGDDIQVSAEDAQLKAAIQQWVDKQNHAEPPMHAWLIDGKNPWTIFNSGLAPALQSEFVIGTFPLISSPSPQAVTDGAVSKQIVAFCYAPAASPYDFKTFDIVVSSSRYNQEQKDAAQPIANDEANRIPLQPGPAPGVQAFALLSAHDFSSPIEKERLLQSFASVAAEAWNISHQGGLSPGTKAKESNLQLIVRTISDAYSMAHNNIPARFWQNWPIPKVKFEIVEGRCCTLQIRGVQTVQSADIRVDANLARLTASPKPNAGPQATTNAPATDSQQDCIGDRAPATTKQEKNADGLAQQTEETLKNRFKGRLAALANTVPTYAQIDSIRSDLAAAHEIQPNIRPGIACENSQEIIFEADNRYVIIPIKVTLGIGYSPEQQWFGKSDFEGNNFLLHLLEGSAAKETESMTYAGGNQVQKLGALWALDLAPSSQSTYGFHLSGDYLQDLNQRFGNLTGPILRDRERGVEPSLLYSFTSPQIDSQSNPVKNIYSVQATAGFRFRHVNVEPSSGNILPPLATGSLVALFLDATPSYSYEPHLPAGHPGLGGVDFNLGLHLLRGFPLGDFTFTQILGSAQGTIYFGISEPRDFFVRYRKGLGTSNGETPLFELFRLGGPDTLRGMEQGEFVGQRSAFEQSDAGISARQIVAWFKRSPKQLQPEPTPKPSPIDLSKIYLTGFYDRAKVANTASFSDLFLFDHAPKGYGMGVEIQSLSAGTKRLSLSLGYGYSPDSILHRKGLVVTNTRLDF